MAMAPLSSQPSFTKNLPSCFSEEDTAIQMRLEIAATITPLFNNPELDHQISFSRKIEEIENRILPLRDLQEIEKMMAECEKRIKSASSSDSSNTYTYLWKKLFYLNPSEEKKRQMGFIDEITRLKQQTSFSSEDTKKIGTLMGDCDQVLMQPPRFSHAVFKENLHPYNQISEEDRNAYNTLWTELFYLHPNPDEKDQKRLITRINHLARQAFLDDTDMREVLFMKKKCEKILNTPSSDPALQTSRMIYSYIRNTLNVFSPPRRP